jgi:hypothetical protein
MASPAHGLTSIDATNRRSLLTARGVKLDSPRGCEDLGPAFRSRGKKNESLHIYVSGDTTFFQVNFGLIHWRQADRPRGPCALFP